MSPESIFSFSPSGATGANIVVNSFTNGWLQEHIDLGLPAAEDVVKYCLYQG